MGGSRRAPKKQGNVDKIHGPRGHTPSAAPDAVSTALLAMGRARELHRDGISGRDSAEALSLCPHFLLNVEIGQPGRTLASPGWTTKARDWCAQGARRGLEGRRDSSRQPLPIYLTGTQQGSSGWARGMWRPPDMSSFGGPWLANPVTYKPSGGWNVSNQTNGHVRIAEADSHCPTSRGVKVQMPLYISCRATGHSMGSTMPTHPAHATYMRTILMPEPVKRGDFLALVSGFNVNVSQRPKATSFHPPST